MEKQATVLKDAKNALAVLEAERAQWDEVINGLENSLPGTMAEQAELVRKLEVAEAQAQTLDLRIVEAVKAVDQAQEARRQAAITAKVAAKGKYKAAAGKLIEADKALQELGQSYDYLLADGMEPDYVIDPALIAEIHQVAQEAELVLRQIGR